MLSLSLSLHPLCSARRLPNFPSRPIFPFFSVSCLDFHSFTSVLPSPRLPLHHHLLSRSPLLSFSLTFLPLSQFIHVNLSAMLSHLCLSLSLLSSLPPPVTSSSSSLSLSLHPSLSTCTSPPLIPSSISIFSFCPSFLF